MKPKPSDVVILLVFCAALASAANLPAMESEVSGMIDASMCFLYGFLKNIVGPIAILMLVWFGLQYVGAQDDMKKRQRVKSSIKELIIALLFIEVIPYIVLSFAGGNLNCT